MADCLAEVDEQFDKAYALLKAELASLRSLDPDTRTAILHDSAYIAGMKFGWNCAEANDRDRYEKVVEAHIRDAKEARAASPKPVALDPVRLEAAAREGHDATWGGYRYGDLPESLKESTRVMIRAAILTYLGKTEGE